MIPNSIFTVYKLVNNANGRAYYGRTKNPQGRLYYHTMACGRGSHYNAEMNTEHSEKGWEFVAIQDGLTQREANRLSDQLAKDDETCYNKLGVVASNKGGARRTLTAEDVEAIRNLYFAGEFNQNELADQFNVTQGLVSLTVNGLIHNRGEFTPPDRKPEGYDGYARGKHQRMELRARMNELNAQGVTHLRTAYKMIAKEFDLHRDTVVFWLHNDPVVQYRDQFKSANLTHAPSTKHVMVDGERFHSVIEWAKETGRKVKDTIWVSKGTYITRENRIVTVDGVPYKIGRKHLLKTLHGLGVWPVERVSEFVYKTVGSYEQQARDALKDPVRARMTGRVLVAATGRKHRCNRAVMDIMRQLVAEPAGS